MSTKTDRIQVEAEHLVKAPAHDVYRYIADYRNHHHRFLPDAFVNYTVERGGIGTGTVLSFSLKLGGKTNHMRVTVDETDPGAVLKEISLNTDSVTTFEVIPQGVAALVRIHTEWTPATGFQGWIERKFAPRMLQELYREELINLDLYAGQHIAARFRELSRVA
jgi:hypothetical protein